MATELDIMATLCGGCWANTTLHLRARFLSRQRKLAVKTRREKIKVDTKISAVPAGARLWDNKKLSEHKGKTFPKTPRLGRSRYKVLGGCVVPVSEATYQ